MCTRQDVLISIQLLADGYIEVVDHNGDRIKALSPEEFSKKLPGKSIKNSYICSILYTNPCGWVCVNDHWYYRCR